MKLWRWCKHTSTMILLTALSVNLLASCLEAENLLVKKVSGY